MMKFDKSMVDLLKSFENSKTHIYDYMNKLNPPSLWAYYETLPSWARSHPVIKNVFMAFEYHKPSVDIR